MNALWNAQRQLRLRVVRPLRLAVDPVLSRVAGWQRSRYPSVTVIGVTGSCGKTAAKDMIDAVCGRRLRGVKSQDTKNTGSELRRTLFTFRSSTEYAVIEMSGGRPGALDASLAAARPQIGAITTIGGDHYRNFRSPEATAAEKGKLIACLPPDGTAILNADDPHVLSMRERTEANVITYGLGAEADLHASDVCAAWPERLSLVVRYGDQVQKVQTRVCGAHWVPSVLAALATGLAMGIPLDDAAAAIAEVEPFLSRMQPFEAEGVTFLRDEWKAAYWTMPTAIDFLRAARAPRKIAVFGTISDMPGNTNKKYRRLAHQTLEVADHVVFVGRIGSQALRERVGQSGGALRAFTTVREATEHLREFLQPGDLVLVKGSGIGDHLARIALSWQREVRCWREGCGYGGYCDGCPQLGVASEATATPPAEGDASLQRRLRVAGAAQLFFRRVGARADRESLPSLLSSSAERLVRLGFDAIESLRVGRLVSHPGDPRRCALEVAGPIAQDPRLRGYWYDESRHAMVGMHLGADLIRHDDRWSILEVNLDAALRPERRALYDDAIDPLVRELVDSARAWGFSRLMVVACFWLPDRVEELSAAGREAGIHVEAWSFARGVAGAEQPFVALPDPLPRDTLVVIESSRHTPIDFAICDKLTSARLLAESLAADDEAAGILEQTPTFDSLHVPSLDADPRWPNLVVKLTGWDGGRFVRCAKARDHDEARRVLGVDDDSRPPRALAIGFGPRLINAVTGRGGVLYQPFVPLPVDSEGCGEKDRIHLLVTPLGARFLSAHTLVASKPPPPVLPIGLVEDDAAYLMNFSKGGRYRRSEPHIEQAARPVAEALGRLLGRAIERKFHTTSANAGVRGRAIDAGDDDAPEVPSEPGALS